MRKRQDIVLGLFFVALGLAAATMATEYAGASGRYPMVLGLILALLGGTVTFRALRPVSAPASPGASVSSSDAPGAAPRVHVGVRSGRVHGDRAGMIPEMHRPI